MDKTILTYDNQLEFKKYARKSRGVKDFYFDYITCVDADTDMDIPGVTADGTMTWGQAIAALVKHFKTT